MHKIAPTGDMSPPARGRPPIGRATVANALRRRVDCVDDALLALVTVALADDGGGPSHGYRVAASGEIDVRTAPNLAEALDSLIDQGATLIVLDASQIEFLDSSGLRVIVASGIRLSNAGGRLLIEGMSGAVQRVLEVSGLIEQYRA